MNQKVLDFNKTQREKGSVLQTLPDLRAGDVVKVYRKIKEGNKTRTQMFQGMIIAINGGQSSSPTITVRKVSSGVGVELILPLLSPQVEKIEFVKRTRARRSKLYFVRDKSVKVLSKKLKEIPLSEGAKAKLEERGQEFQAAPEEPVEEEKGEIVEEGQAPEEAPVSDEVPEAPVEEGKTEEESKG